MTAPLAPAHDTLLCCGTPAGNHCCRGYKRYYEYYYLILEVELSLERWRVLSRRQDGNGVTGVGGVGRLAVAHDQESIGALSVVNEIADQDGLLVLWTKIRS